MNPAASILLAKFGLPLGALGSLAAQRSIEARYNIAVKTGLCSGIVVILHFLRNQPEAAFSESAVKLI